MTEACQMLILRLASHELGICKLTGEVFDLRVLMEEEHVLDEHQTALE